jgi:hypothetical protein
VAGYSGTPLARKLGIMPGHRLGLIDAPAGFEDALKLPEEVTVRSQARGTFDVILYFSSSEKALARRFDKLARRLAPDGGLWIGWPKKASKVPTDLSFDVVQTIGLRVGLVDNKVCAIDDTYSGLRFVVRVEDRDGWPPPAS